MNHFIASSFSAFVFAFPAGIFFAFRREKAERMFGLFWLAVAFWSYFVAMQFRLLQWMPGALWGWLLHLGCIFVPVVFLNFAVRLCQGKYGGLFLLRLAYLGAAIFVLLNTFTDLFTEGTVYGDQYAYPKPAVLYPLYIFFFQAIGMWSTFLIFEWGRKLNARSRRMVYLFLLVHILAYIGSTDNFLIMYDLRIFPLYPYGLYLILPYVVLGSYAVFGLKENGAVTK